MIQWLTPAVLPVAALLLGILAFMMSSKGLRAILRRTRWLFLTMVLLFLLLTPGVRLQPPWGTFGLTQEGLDTAIEHCLRLFAQLAWLVVLLSQLGVSGLVAGLHALIRHIPGLSAAGDRLVIRLALTLEEIGAEQPKGWQSYLNSAPSEGPASIALSAPPWRRMDSVVLILALATTLMVLLVPA